MNRTANKRRKVQMPAGIRNKMMAAISMLLVSTVMMVSSTYAWFTLSTAPEVTGITTNVGANGNLEMMLLTGSLGTDGVSKEGSYYSDKDDLGVISQVGDSMAAAKQTVLEANETWGNLVDLSDGSYGLSNMVLAPARLNLTSFIKDSETNKVTAATVGNTILNAPSYGSDGRVIDVNTATYAGKYTDAGTFAYDDAHKGVRVLGTTTDVSQRLAAYRTAKGAVTTNANAAKNSATTSLAANGQDLANILMAYVSDSSTKYTNKDLRVLLKVLTALEDATEYTEVAIKNAVLANSLSSNNTAELDDDAVADLKTDIDAVEIESTGTAGTTCFDGVTNVVIPANLETAIETYVALEASISTALDKLNAVDDTTTNDIDESGLAPGLTLTNVDRYPDDQGEYGYDEISVCLNYILNRTYVKIGGVEAKKDNLGDIMQDYINKQCIIIDMLDGSGVYAQIANLVGNYTASGFTVNVTHEMLGDKPVDVPVTMNTLVTVDKQIQAITFGSAPEDSSQAANSVLSNTYGYAIDFGFRTNATASSLQLQTAAVNRVYSSDTDSTLRTQGAGSYMQFTSFDAINFTADDVLALMSAIRVAFVSPVDESYELLAIGALDITSTTSTDSAGLVTTTYSTSGERIDESGAAIADTDTTTVAAGYKVGLYLYNYNITEDTDKIKKLTLGTRMDDESAITALTQNKAAKVTVVVYLDGDIVDNTMVANADNSMRGVLNLQFSSSADLAPMENTGMKNGGSTGETVTYTQKAVAGDTYTIGRYTGTVKQGYTLYTDDAGTVYFSNNGVSYSRLMVTNASMALDITFDSEATEEPDNSNENEGSSEDANGSSGESGDSTENSDTPSESGETA